MGPWLSWFLIIAVLDMHVLQGKNPTPHVELITSKTLSNWRHCYWRRSMARGVRFLDVLLRFEADPNIKMILGRELCYTIIIPAYTIFNKQLFSLAPDIYKIGSR